MGSVAEDRPRATFLSDVLKALAHPVRLRIVAALCDGETSVIRLAERLGLRQAIVSQQLRILRMSGLVAAVRSRGFSLYTLAQPRLRELVSCLEGCHSDAEDHARALSAPSAVPRRTARHVTGGAAGAQTGRSER
jgi:DNA-binding transcriptional ArsR family regulator